MFNVQKHTKAATLVFILLLLLGCLTFSAHGNLHTIFSGAGKHPRLFFPFFLRLSFDVLCIRIGDEINRSGGRRFLHDETAVSNNINISYCPWGNLAGFVPSSVVKRCQMSVAGTTMTIACRIALIEANQCTRLILDVWDNYRRIRPGHEEWCIYIRVSKVFPENWDRLCEPVYNIQFFLHGNVGAGLFLSWIKSSVLNRKMFWIFQFGPCSYWNEWT